MANNYFLSSEVKVFPCAYRGVTTTNEDGTEVTTDYDQLARVPVEYNLTRPVNSFVDYKSSYDQSYIIQFTSADDGTQYGIIECMIGGYYFYIESDKIKKPFVLNGGYWLAINTTQITVKEVQSTVLCSFEDNNSTNIDRQNATTKQAEFTALCYGDAATQPPDYKHILKLDTKHTYFGAYTNIVSEDATNPITGRLIPSTDISVIAASLNTGIKYVPKSNYKIDTNNGNEKTNSILLGKGLIAYKNDGIYLGQYNAETDDAILTIANGTLTTTGVQTPVVNSHNAITISENTVTINSSLKLDQVPSIDLTAATITANATNDISNTAVNILNYATTDIKQISSTNNSICEKLNFFTTGLTDDYYANIGASGTTPSPAAGIYVDTSDSSGKSVSEIWVGTSYIDGDNNRINNKNIKLDGINGNIIVPNASITNTLTAGTLAFTNKIDYTITDSASAKKIITVTCSNVETASLDECGNLIATTYEATSDARLKENIEDFAPTRSILNLQTKKYDFINGPKNQIGCLAQDLQKICPEIVHENEDGYLSIQESKIVYLLLDEVKKLKYEIDQLKGNE